MSALDSLCQLPPPAPRGCCAPPAADPASARPSNPPGLSVVRYRIGTFTSFRRAMLSALPAPGLLSSAPNPFTIWREGSDGDYQTMFIELWAYLADILTFYQERIANEALLPTATQIDSMSRITALIGYHPGPGSGASGTVAFTTAKGKTVSIPAGFRVGSKAQPAANGKPAKTAAVFESESALVALDEHNAIALSPVAPTNQFAFLASFGTFFGPSAVDTATLATIAADLYGDAASIYVTTFPSFRKAASQTFTSAITEATAVSSAPTGFARALPAGSVSRASTRQAFSVDAPALLNTGGGFFVQRSGNFDIGFVNTGNIGIFINTPPKSPGFTYQPFTDGTTRTIVFRGLNLGVEVGDQLLAVENEAGTDSAHPEKATLHQVTAVTTDKDSNTTTIKWIEEPNQKYDASQTDVAVHRFKVEAGVFGNTAPLHDTLSTELTGTGKVFAGDWDDPNSEWFRLPSPAETSKSEVLLDSVFDDANGTPQNPGWAVLMTDRPPDPFIAHVIDARPVSRSAYAITSKITRLTFLQSEVIPTTPAVFPVRTTVVLCGSEKLALQNNLPLPEEVSGDTVILTGVHRQLRSGQPVILTGPLASSTDPTVPVIHSELRTIKAPPNVSDTFGITTVILDRPLEETYTRVGSALLANVVNVTQGETVKDEVLGSGNGRELQSFTLKKSPLTFLPSTDPESVSAVKDALIVTVNGVAWREVTTLLESAPDDQVYTTTRDTQGKTTVVFGDGFHGARPSTGVDNIHARYRKGLGTSGDVDPGGVQQLVDSIPGLQRVANPLATGGAADPEDVAGIRRNAPASVRAFGRAVSAGDYASLALTFPGVGKASSVWVPRTDTLQPVIHPYVQLTIAAANQVALAGQPTFAAGLRRFLDARRDPNVSLRIVDFKPVALDVALTVDLDDRFPRQNTLSKAQAAATDFFAFENLDFGESVHLSSLYAALLSIPGVIDANVTTLRRLDAAGSGQVVEDTIFIRPTEVASVDAPGSLLVTLGQGGFADQ